VAGLDSLANVGDLVSLWYGQGSDGRDAALAQVASSLQATNSFLEDAYGFFGELGIAGLLGDQIVVGSEDTDLSLEERLGFSGNTFIHGGSGDDLLVGWFGKDTLDGGTGADEASFYLVSGNMTEGLSASLFHLDSSAQFSAEIVGEEVQSFLFNVEELELGRHDDILEVVSLDGATSVKEVYGGDNGLLGDKIDLSSVTTQGAIVNLESNTLRLTDSPRILEIHDFENAFGTSNNDTITGDDEANGINGHLGADHLFGGGGDDFIFFDAADGGNVNGGDGRDVAVALGEGAVTVDMHAQQLEVVIGGGGADDITISGSDQPQMAAGGGNSDTFHVTYDDVDAPKVLWGGAGADVFDFTLSNPESCEQFGIAVVRIDGLTAESFAQLTLADLGLGDIDLSKIDAIIINPDQGDVFLQDGYLIDASTLVDGWIPEEAALVFDVQQSTYLGGAESHAIQSLFNTDFETRHSDQWQNYLITVTPTRTVVTEVDSYVEVGEGGYASLEEAIVGTTAYAELIFAEYGDLAQVASDVPIYSFFIVGGHFSGASLIDNGDFTVTLPDPGITPFDWRLAA
jgi:hypothetical protein